MIGGFVDIDGCIFDNSWVDVCLYNEQKICGKRGEIKNSIFNSNNSVGAHSAIDLQNNGKDIINNIFYNQKSSLPRYYAITLKNYKGLIKNNTFGNSNLGSFGINCAIYSKYFFNTYYKPYNSADISIHIIGNNFGGYTNALFPPFTSINIQSTFLNYYHLMVRNEFNKNNDGSSAASFYCSFFGEFTNNKLFNSKLLLSNTNNSGQNVGFNYFEGDLNKIETVGNLRSVKEGQVFYCNQFVSPPNNTIPDLNLGGNIIDYHGFINPITKIYMCTKNEYTQSAKSINSSGAPFNYYHSSGNYQPQNNTGSVNKIYNSLSQGNICGNLANSFSNGGGNEDKAKFTDYDLGLNVFDELISEDSSLSISAKSSLIESFERSNNLIEEVSEESPCFGEYISNLADLIYPSDVITDINTVLAYLDQVDINILNHYAIDHDNAIKKMSQYTVQKVKNGIVDRLLVDQRYRKMAGQTIDMNYLISIARKYNNPMSEYKIAHWYMEDKNWTAARQIFENMATLYELDIIETQDKNNMIALLNLFDTLKYDDRKIAQATVTEIDQLKIIEGSNTSTASKIACDMLSILGENCSNTQNDISVYDNSEEIAPILNVTVSPNPNFQNDLTIVSDFNMSLIEIYNQSGNMIISQTPEQPSYTIITTELDAGNYILKVYNTNYQYASFNIIKQ